MLVHVLWFHSSIYSNYKIDSSKGYYPIAICLLVHHIFSYLSATFRKWEIEKHGQVDLNGVMRAKKESFIRTIEIFTGCLISGFTLNYSLLVASDEINQNPLIHIWLIVDCVLMLCLFLYVYLTHKMIVSSELTKNMYSLHFCQMKQIQETKKVVKASL